MSTAVMSDQKKSGARANLKIDAELHALLKKAAGLAGKDIGEYANDLLGPVVQREYSRLLAAETRKHRPPKE